MAVQQLSEYSHFFEVRLDLFKGPVDLLLHLVKQNELSIEKISLAQVANQYLECVEAIKHFDLDVAGEYLVIAATLLSIKSAVLLNQPVELIENEDGEFVDPHEELLKRLREAEIYKEGASALCRRDLLDLDVFAAPGSLNGVDAPPPKWKPHDALLLGMAFKKVLEKVGDQPLLTISFENVSVVEKMMGIVSRLEKSAGTLSFAELLSEDLGKVGLIGSFIALLELCKRQVILVFQDDLFKDIRIGLASAAGAQGEAFTSEFDAQGGAEQKSVHAN